MKPVSGHGEVERAQLGWEVHGTVPIGGNPQVKRGKPPNQADGPDAMKQRN